MWYFSSLPPFFWKATKHLFGFLRLAAGRKRSRSCVSRRLTHNHAVFYFCGQDIALIVSKVCKCGIKMIFSKFALFWTPAVIFMTKLKVQRTENN